MKSLLAKIAFRKAVGLYLGEHEVTVSKVAATPLGPVELASSSEPYTSEDLADVIERLLVPLVGHRHRLPVAVGLPSSRLFFGTRLTAAGSATTAEGVLQKTLCSSNISVDDLTVDLLRSDVNKLPVASVAACRKKYMVGVLATLSRLGVRPVRTEPSPCALVRLAAQQHRPPRRAKTVLRVFLNATNGLAVLVADSLPLAWRSFPLPANLEGFAILSAARTLQTQHKHYGIESSLDYAMIHGRADLHERLQQEQFATDVGTRVIWHEGPVLSGATAASGLALGCLTQSITAFDLSRDLKTRPSLWEVFPWWDLAFTAVLVAIMGLVLGAHSMKLNDAYAVVRVQSSQHKCLASTEPGRLEKERKALAEKVEAVRKFLDTRIVWTAYTNDISARLPANAVLEMFEGKNGLECGGKSDSKKSFQLRARAPLTEEGATPREIDAFLSALRNHPLLKRDFGSVELAGIKRFQNSRTAPPGASFTVICLPNPKGATSPASDGASGKSGKKEAK